ncbi:MAG: division/cell wall cluster transcriptional repressor MraZ [bacterium]|jgi:MraZ protein|nr:division/cell wall cluster transcriptional repressor MraZ [Planctomycetota bacterium]HIL52061.1 division/cell wall cluster transcriptional repressor MraZ [Planctomycetota bacterium]
MFFDSSEHTMDAKNRVFVPKRFQLAIPRDESGAQPIFLTRGLDGCLFLFSEPGFARALERLDTQAFTGKQQRRMQRLFFSNTTKLNLDASGRLLIPEKLCKQVGLEKDVVMVGVVHRAEIWPKDRWEALEAEMDGEFDSLDSVLCEGSSAEGEDPPR